MEFLYRWDGYYFLQGFWVDIRILMENIDPSAIIVCFLMLLVLFTLPEVKRIKVRNAAFIVFAALYGAFLLTITLLARRTGKVSFPDGLFSTYSRALSGDIATQSDVLYNTVLFVPVGVLLSHYKRDLLNVIALLLIPIAIETAQLVTGRGVFELSDIVSNFIGGMIGFLAVRSISKLFHFLRRIINKRKDGRVERAE